MRDSETTWLVASIVCAVIFLILLAIGVRQEMTWIQATYGDNGARVARDCLILLCIFSAWGRK